MVKEEQDFTNRHQLCEQGTVVGPCTEKNKITQDLQCVQTFQVSEAWISRFNSSKEGWGKFTSTSTSDTETELQPWDLDLFIALRDHYTGTHV